MSDHAGRSDLVDIAGERRRETDRAILLFDGAREAWLPKALRQVALHDGQAYERALWYAEIDRLKAFGLVQTGRRAIETTWWAIGPAAAETHYTHLDIVRLTPAGRAFLKARAAAALPAPSS